MVSPWPHQMKAENEMKTETVLDFGVFRQVCTSHRLGGLWVMAAGELRSAYMNRREHGRGRRRACTERKPPFTADQAETVRSPAVPGHALSRTPRNPSSQRLFDRRAMHSDRCLAPPLARAALPGQRQHVMESGAKRRTPKRPYGPRMGCRSRKWQRSTGALPPHRRMPDRLSRVATKLAIPRGGSRFGVRCSAPLSHSVPNVSGQWLPVTTTALLSPGTASLGLL